MGGEKDEILPVLVERFFLVKVSPPAAIRTLPVCERPVMSPIRSTVAHGQLLTALFLDERQNAIS